MVVFGVAPVRERGLKFMFKPTSRESCRRSREGAWIEIHPGKLSIFLFQCRSREGAWIEISFIF